MAKVSGKQLVDTVPIVNGGTGATDAAGARTALGALGTSDTISKATAIAGGTAGQIPYQSAPNTTAFVTNGSAGQLLQSNGSGAPSFVTFSGGFTNIAVLTTTQTWTIPAGVTKAKFTVVGGGGCGGTSGAGCGYWYSGPGGAGGGTAIKYLSGLTPGNTLSVTVGAGGTSSGAGGSSSIASGTQTITTVTGGGGAGAGGQGGAGTNGDLNIRGGVQPGHAVSAFRAAYMPGGSSHLSPIASGAGLAYGGGGAGGGTAAGVLGGTGAAGVVIIEY